jgi:hypothetical protein
MYGTQNHKKNIHHSYTAASKAVIHKFFNYPDREIDGVPNGSCWNHDVANPVDCDKDIKKIRDKYDVKIQNALTSCMLLMVCRMHKDI